MSEVSIRNASLNQGVKNTTLPTEVRRDEVRPAASQSSIAQVAHSWLGMRFRGPTVKRCMINELREVRSQIESDVDDVGTESGDHGNE